MYDTLNLRVTRFTNETALNETDLLKTLCSYQPDIKDKCLNVKNITQTLLDGDPTNTSAADGFQNKMPLKTDEVLKPSEVKGNDLSKAPVIEYFVIDNYQIVFA
jgi:hypothetical protein